MLFIHLKNIHYKKQFKLFLVIFFINANKKEESKCFFRKKGDQKSNNFQATTPAKCNL